MRIGIDFETCESHASCMEAAPEVFEVREDGALYILQETPDDMLRPKVEEAARLCPTQSIWIID